MLVLTRRKDQQLVIPSLGVTVKVLEATRGTVRIGLDAPDEIAIRRCELGPFKPEPCESGAVAPVEFCEIAED